MIFVDSGAWYACYVPSDADHAAATRWRTANTVPLLTTDYIIDETLTLMAARGHGDRALAFGVEVFGGQLATTYYLSPSEIAAAWDVFQRFRDKEWSFTDCTSKVVIETLGISQAFSFDQHFRQFGTVAVMP